MDEKRSDWVAGRCDHLDLGGYGSTIHLEVVSSGVRVQTITPRRQEIIGPDTPRTRELALRVADKYVANKNGGVRSQGLRRARKVKGAAGLLTPRDIWMSMLRGKLGPVPQGILGWGKKRLLKYYAGLDEEGRAAVWSFDTLNNILTAARALDRRGIVPFDCEVKSLRAGTITQRLQAWVLEGRKVSTVSTYWGRFRTAVREHQLQWPGSWEARRDPTASVKRPKRRGRRATEIGEKRAVRLLNQLKEDGEWQAAACVLITRGSGRRIGAISGQRDGLHLDAPPLTAADFRRDDDGQLLVNWRAEVAKGRNYGRGDHEHTASFDLELAYRWLTRFHPNPEGPEHPLIWDADDPTLAASYDSLTAAFDRAWKEAFGEAKPKGLAWHAIIKTTITTIAEEEGAVPAAVLTGREVETVERHYLARRREHQEAAVAALNRRRRTKRGQAAE